MSKNRAARRHETARKKARTHKILKRYAGRDDVAWLSPRRIGKFTESRWGCQCHLCVNPRRLGKGKRRDSLTLKEFHNDSTEE